MSRVLFVSHTNAPGGAELTVRAYLEKTGIEDVALATFQHGGVWQSLPDRVAVHTPAPADPLRQMQWLRATIKDSGASMVIATTMRSALLCAVALPSRCQLVYWVHDGLGSESAMGSGALALTRFVTLPRVSRFITNSQWTDRTLKAWRPKATSVVVAPQSGLELKQIDARSPRRLGDGPVRLLYLGRISSWKAPHLAIEALEIAERDSPGGFTLTIAGGAQFGENDYREQFLKRLKESPVRGRINYVGHVDNPQSLFDEHDLLVHTSVVPEPFGRVVLEAFSHGVPVMTPAAGGPLDLVRTGENGELYRIGSPQGLCTALKRASDPEMYSKESAGALQASKGFTDEVLVKRMDEAVQRWLAA